MSQLSNDDQVDRDLRSFLDWQAGQLDGAPSAARASARLAQRLGTGAGPRASRRLVLAVVIVGVLMSLAIGEALVGSRGPDPLVVVPPSQPSQPIPSSSPSVLSTTGMPTALQAIWIGPPKLVPALSGDPQLGLLHVVGSTFLLFNGGGTQPILKSTGTISDSGDLVLTLDAATSGCAAGSVGSYAWSVSSDGAQLTLSVRHDGCPVRAAAFGGTWIHSACRDPQDTCLGPIPAGTFTSTFFDIRDATSNVPLLGAYGQLRYSVPTGWANRDDWPTNFSLMPATDYAGAGGDPNGNTVHGIYLYARPAAMAATADCSAQLIAGVPSTPAGLAAWLAGRADLVTSHPVPVVIDGDAGVMVDVRLGPTRAAVCPGDSQASAPLLTDATGSAANWSLRIGSGEQMRIVLITVGPGRIVAIVIDDNSTPSRFDSLVTQAVPIVQSFAFPK